MANQTAEHVIASLKRETTFGTPASSGAGGSRIRLYDSPGLKYTRAPITDDERRPDQIEPMDVLGGANVNGSYETPIVPGDFFDLLCESMLRGTLGALADTAYDADTQLAKVETPATPVNYSYSVEQNDSDIDDSELFIGVRNTQLDLALQPRARGRATWTFQGVDRQIVGSASAPYFTNPTEVAGDSLIVDNAYIYYDSAQLLVCTGLNISLAIAAATQDVIGTFVSPDVYMNRIKVTGSIGAVRQDLAALADFDAETEFEIYAKLLAPGTGARLTWMIRLPRVKITDIDAPFLGGNAAKVEMRQFTGSYPIGYHNAVEIYTSTGTPVAHS